MKKAVEYWWKGRLRRSRVVDTNKLEHPVQAKAVLTRLMARAERRGATQVRVVEVK